tara:strand:+ start:89 stop:301 length:213 start_codon:yes stop_codon:yes gene_type:complete
MVAYVMDDERVIKSAWTPEVRTALDDGEANVFLSLYSSSPRPRSRRRRDARARESSNSVHRGNRYATVSR